MVTTLMHCLQAERSEQLEAEGYIILEKALLKKYMVRCCQRSESQLHDSSQSRNIDFKIVCHAHGES